MAMANQQFPLAASIRNSLPADAKVTIHDDGSIEYLEIIPHKAPNGYKVDPDNPRLFRPEWPVCLKRLCGVRHNNGLVDLTMICSHGEVKEHFMRQVQPSVCSQCPLRVEKK